MNRKALQLATEIKYALLTQGVRSAAPDGACRYRSEEGFKCAAGFKIKDEFYRRELEGKDCTNGDVVEALIQSGVDEDLLPWLFVCQGIHDYYNVNDWPTAFKLLQHLASSDQVATAITFRKHDGPSMVHNSFANTFS
jgi:hypothetical protein